MQRKKNRDIEWLEFDLLANVPKISHGVFLRHGGFSPSPYTSLNIGDNVGDDPQNVHKNFLLILESSKIPLSARLRQCHGKEIHNIDSHEKVHSSLLGDAITTNIPGIGLSIGHADCQAAIFYDPIHHALANVHAGWRGSALNIYDHTIQFMKKTYGTSAKELLVCISPSLGPKSAQFINYQEELPQAFWGFQIAPEYFDFWEISRWQLQKSGVLLHHIEIANMDTFSNPQDFFSYRRDRQTGRHGTIVMLRESLRKDEG